jgi:hypothetical protein
VYVCDVVRVCAVVGVVSDTAGRSFGAAAGRCRSTSRLRGGVSGSWGCPNKFCWHEQRAAALTLDSAQKASVRAIKTLMRAPRLALASAADPALLQHIKQMKFLLKNCVVDAANGLTREVCDGGRAVLRAGICQRPSLETSRRTLALQHCEAFGRKRGARQTLTRVIAPATRLLLLSLARLRGLQAADRGSRHGTAAS